MNPNPFNQCHNAQGFKIYFQLDLTYSSKSLSNPWIFSHALNLYTSFIILFHTSLTSISMKMLSIEAPNLCQGKESLW